MNEAEKMAQRFRDAMCDEGVDGQLHEDAAALIREQEAKIKRLSEALRDVWSNDYISYRHNLKINHAEALRDAGVKT
jgi:hypothetical protein